MKYSTKLFMTLTLVSFSSCYLYPVQSVTDELEVAVREGDLLKLKKSLRKLDRTQITAQEKKVTFAYLIGLTDDIITAESSDVIPLSNRLDVVRCLGGALLGIYGLSRVASNWHTLYAEETCYTCNHILCNNSCSTVLLADNRQKIEYAQSSSSRFMHGIKGLPYIGFTIAGFYQVYEALKGAGRLATISTAQRIQELLKTKAGE